MRRDKSPGSSPRPAVLALALLGLACHRTAANPHPEVADQSRAEDADQLPAFEHPDPKDAPVGPERFRVELGDAPVRGPASAPVTIVMFSDFECPFCRQGHELLEALQKRYPGQIRLAYKAFPLDIHSNALTAAMAARSAQAQGKFWQFHDLLFSEKGIDTPQLMADAKQVGLDPAALSRDLASLKYGPAVRREIRQGRRLGVDSTPVFFINGRELSGAQPFSEFVTIVDDELQRAEKWRAEGVPPDEIYAHAIENGYRKVVYRDPKGGLDPDGVFPVPVGESPRLGPDDAPVTIVSFGDFECPFCVRGFHTLQSLRERYGDKLRIVYKFNPLSFHSHAFIACRAALAAAAQGKFWAYHDALYALGADFDEDDLVAIGKKVGLDMPKFFKAMNSTSLDQRIEEDLSLGAALGVTGTPAYFIDGRPLEGAQPEIQFRLLIEEELERAAAARAKGVAASDVYETLTHQPLDDG